MEYTGTLRKMKSELKKEVEYSLLVGEEEIRLNEFIGGTILLNYSGEIYCIRCGRKTGKSFAQGYCFPCFKTAPETEDCVLKPELCLAHDGIARDMEYAASHCLIEHVVYLSVTSDLKVGVTRHTQVPTRWIDQGAVRAIELARTENRYQAGSIEVFLKQYLKDKTNWRAMLKNEITFEGNLAQRKSEVLELLPDEMKAFGIEEDRITEISYPVEAYPVKISSLNFDKEAHVGGNLSGIKGQYLIFDDGSVLNIRKFGGYHVTFSA